MRCFLIATLIAAFALSASAEEKSDLAANMKNAKVSLERGMAASKSKGTPISAKYEIEDGKLQLSVYTARSEEHTSELQSQSNLVCRLLLEKKNQSLSHYVLLQSTRVRSA